MSPTGKELCRHLPGGHHRSAWLQQDVRVVRSLHRHVLLQVRNPSVCISKSQCEYYFDNDCCNFILITLFKHHLIYSLPVCYCWRTAALCLDFTLSSVFFRNKHIMIDLGTGNNNKINWTMEDKQEMIDIVETVYRGARKGRGLVVSPKDYSTKYRYWFVFSPPTVVFSSPDILWHKTETKRYRSQGKSLFFLFFFFYLCCFWQRNRTIFLIMVMIVLHRANCVFFFLCKLMCYSVPSTSFFFFLLEDRCWRTQKQCKSHHI